LPPNRYILVPRTWKEAHNRPDSLCSVLGIPFTELGPLLFAAGILKKFNLYEGLSFSPDGFEILININNRKKPELELELEKESLRRMCGRPTPMSTHRILPSFFIFFVAAGSQVHTNISRFAL
jgi:hypothetical protein